MFSKIGVVIFCLYISLFPADVVISNGNISSPRPQGQCLAIMAGWYDVRNVTIGTSNIVIYTSYPNMLCEAMRNETTKDVVICYSTQVQPDSSNMKRIHLAAGEHSGLMPPISRIWNSAAGSDTATLTLYFHKF